jgi:hypothetical protein
MWLVGNAETSVAVTRPDSTSCDDSIDFSYTPGNSVIETSSLSRLELVHRSDQYSKVRPQAILVRSTQ